MEKQDQNYEMNEQQAEAPETPEASEPQQAEVPESQQPEDKTPEAQQPEAKKPARWKKELREWVVSLGVALLIVLVVRTCLFTFIRVDGTSMCDTLQNKERLFVTVADVKLFGVERGDVVICHYPNRGRTRFVKRVVGVPGDQVERENGVTYILYTDESGQSVREPMDEARATRYPGGSPDDYEPYTLGKNEYFVVGDNRYVSHDSRDWNDRDPSNDVGPITGDMIMGRARCVVWPLDKIRSVK